MPRILFVCLGNICRSPAAEAVLRTLATAGGYPHQFDSAGTSGYHIGEQPDPRMVRAGKRRGHSLVHAARQVTVKDFHAFDQLVAMDASNHAHLIRLAPAGLAHKVVLFGEVEHGGVKPDVPDPYYGPDHGFDDVLIMLERLGPRWLERWAK